MDVLRKKNVDDVIHQNDEVPGDADEGHGRLKKNLSAIDLIGFGIGIVIGTGIFTLTGLQAKENAGPAVTISFLIAGAVALLAALCYAELASAVPTAGSSYTYSYTTIGEIFAWIIAWDLILEFALGSAVVARGWSGYVAGVFDLPEKWFAEEGSVVNVGAIAIVILLGWVAMRGIRESAWVTNGLVVIKVLVCVFVIAVGAFYVKTGNLVPFIPESTPTASGSEASGLHAPLWQFLSGIEPATFGITGVFVAAAVVFFAYSGFEAVANLGEETKNPKRDMPLGLLGTLGICTLLYVGVCLVLTGMVHYSDLSEGDAVADVFDQVGLEWAGILIGVAAVAGLTSVILVDLVAMGRIGFALARDGLLPEAFRRIHPTWGTPVLMTGITVVVVALLAGFVPISVLAEMVSIGTLFAFVVVAIAVIVLRRTEPDMNRPFRAPWVPILPIVTVAACLGLMASLKVDTWLRFIVWLVLGLAVYFVYGYKHSRLNQVAEGERS
ncbi:APC family permease [Aeromicrobium duanguangcaii]|uniref:Amino acid permease n=1 Tax=Aeromicrobium duanguangcaii TaxID=2968086 RepID=A0ABY5KCQ5_9ACTN|nr:amino acid permease [Aeromicrobium duanguangcaii]MCD9155027.1 amino acid permease [Aeromicrobium duanguangcaii]UUI67569.1 amino acid permease [Aeromicrobium duanguangcaii]